MTPVKNVADNLWDHMQVQHWDSRRIWPVSPTMAFFYYFNKNTIYLLFYNKCVMVKVTKKFPNKFIIYTVNFPHNCKSCHSFQLRLKENLARFTYYGIFHHLKRNYNNFTETVSKLQFTKVTINVHHKKL